MLTYKRLVLMTITSVLLCSAADAQFNLHRVAEFGNPEVGPRRITGGREVEFSADGDVMIAAFYGSTAQLFDLRSNTPIGVPIRTAGDGEVGFVNHEIAYTADWRSVRLWDVKTGQQIGDAIPHELREDTIIRPAISPDGELIASRATMNSVQLLDVTSREMIGSELTYSTVVHSIRFSGDGKILFVRAGGLLHAIDSETGDNLVSPIKSGWRFYYFPEQQKLVTTERVGENSDRLVFRSTDQKNWPVLYSSNLPGEFTRIVPLSDSQFLLQAKESDYTPAMFVVSLDDPDSRIEIESDADRAFNVVVAQDKRHWVSTNIRDIRCHRLGESEPVWKRQIPPSGYDQHLFPFDDEHFVILDKQDNFGIYKIADGSEVWNQDGVNRFKLSKDKIAFCNGDGVEVWEVR